jgi:all-trans-retinol dehydrogenase (NAD+)
MNYPLQPETVAEHIVKAVLAGESAHIVLPRGNGAISGLRMFPNFLQSYLRKDLKKMMTNWKGRQVAQPSEKEPEKKPEKSSANELIEESTVIV